MIIFLRGVWQMVHILSLFIPHTVNKVCFPTPSRSGFSGFTYLAWPPGRAGADYSGSDGWINETDIMHTTLSLEVEYVYSSPRQYGIG